MIVCRLDSSDLAGFRDMNALFGRVFQMDDDYLGAMPSDAYVADWLADGRNLAVVARSDESIVGALAGYVLEKFEQQRREIFIYDLAVDADFRRRGIATAMIGEVRRIGREAGAWTIFVQADVGDEDVPARALYRKLASEEIMAHHFDIEP